MSDKKEVIISVSLEGDAIKDTEQLSENIKDVKNESKEAIQDFGIMDTGLGKMASGIIAFGRKGVTAMKTLKGAIAATGIGLLVIAVTSLIAYFTKTERGAGKLRVVMAALGQVVSTITDVFIKIGETLGKIGKIIGKVVKGQATFKEGWQETKEVVGDAVEDLGEGFKEMGANIERAQALAERENQLRIDRRENLVDEARLVTELAQVKQQMDDQTKSEQERLEFLNKASELQNEISNERIRLAKEDYEITKAKNALSESTEEDMEKEAELLSELILLEAERADRQKEFADKRSALLKAEEDRRIALRESLEEERLTFEEQVEKDLQTQADNIDKELELEQKGIEASLSAQEKEIEEQKRLNAIKLAIQQDFELAKLDVIQQGLNSLSDIFSENKEAQLALLLVGKVVAIGQIIQSTAIANAKAIATFPLTLGQPWVTLNTVSAGLSIASVITAAAKATQEANAVQVPKKALGGWIGGPSHLAGGTTFEGEGGEYIVNKRAMANPAIAQSVINANSGMGGTRPLTEERVIELAAQVVKSVKVEAVESESADLHRTVLNRESRFQR